MWRRRCSQCLNLVLEYTSRFWGEDLAAAWGAIAIIAYARLAHVGLVYSIYFKVAPWLLDIGIRKFTVLDAVEKLAGGACGIFSSAGDWRERHLFPLRLQPELDAGAIASFWLSGGYLRCMHALTKGHKPPLLPPEPWASVRPIRRPSSRQRSRFAIRSGCIRLIQSNRNGPGGYCFLRVHGRAGGQIDDGGN